MATEFRYVGSHADELDGGRPIGPGEFTGPIDPDAPKNKQMIDDGLLVESKAPSEDTVNASVPEERSVSEEQTQAETPTPVPTPAKQQKGDGNE
jgi:hypothetical protein